jgi:hypothetical protein
MGYHSEYTDRRWDTVWDTVIVNIWDTVWGSTIVNIPAKRGRQSIGY